MRNESVDPMFRWFAHGGNDSPISRSKGSGVIFTNVRILDGTGEYPYTGEVTVQGNRIRQVTKVTADTFEELADKMAETGAAVHKPTFLKTIADYNAADKQPKTLSKRRRILSEACQGAYGVEPLESRVLLAADLWTGAAAGTANNNWSTGANWANGVAPLARGRCRAAHRALPGPGDSALAERARLLPRR